MVNLYEGGAYLLNGIKMISERDKTKIQSLTGKTVSKEKAKKGTITYSLLQAHNISDTIDKLKIKFDAMASHGNSR